MQQLVENGDELYNYIVHCSLPNASKMLKTQLEHGIMVKSNIRSEVLTNDRQGKITIAGTVKQIVFTNLGGGVYLTKVEDL